MRRRVARAVGQLAEGRTVVAFGVLRRYDPRLITSVAAIGYGAAAATSGGTSVRLPDGTTRNALAEGAARLVSAGSRAAARYLPLPPKVLVVAGADDVTLYEWTMSGAGSRRARWQKGTFTAKLERFTGEIGVEVVDASGKIALLTARSRPTRRWPRTLVNAIVAASASPPAG